MNEKQYLKHSFNSSVKHVNGLYNSILNDSEKLGPYTKLFAQHIWEAGAHRTVYRLNNFYSQTHLYKRIEAVCKRSVFYESFSLKTANRILIEKLDYLPLSINTDIFGQQFLF
ncbi:MAG: hypothetical protein BV456_10210 [Thermoplasmata archaeon M8B2D]|nr:MAG: hypothetical protein BV456_10210 [Thermoplasmata archaeon M8B2D]